MPLILTGEIYDDGSVDVLCEACKKVVGVMPYPEVAALSRELKENVYCFDCDIASDVIPKHLTPTKTESVVLFNQSHSPVVLLCVDANGMDTAICLSSSTNLHKSPQKCTGTRR